MYDGVVYYIIAHIYVLYRLIIYVTNRILAFVYIIYSTDILYTVSSHLFISYIPPGYGIYRIFAPFCYTSIITFPRTFLCLYTVCSQMFISCTLNSHFHMLYTVYSHHFLLYTAYLRLFIFVTRRCLAAAVIAAVVSVIGLRCPQWHSIGRCLGSEMKPDAKILNARKNHRQEYHIYMTHYWLVNWIWRI